MSTSSSRRNLLRLLGVAGGTALLAPFATRGGSAVYAAAPGDGRSYNLGTAALEIDGAQIPLLATEGGNAVAEFVTEPPGPDLIQRKHVTNVKIEDLVIQVPIGMAKGLSNWISTTLGKGPQAKSGAVVYGDSFGTELKRLEFFNAVLTEITLPACDLASAAGTAALTLRLSPETARLSGPKGKGLSGSSSGAKAVLARTNAFRLNIQGLESASKFVTTVSALTARRPLVSDVGVLRQPGKQLGALECSTLTIALAERDAALFFSWFGDFVTQGNSGERPGRLEYLTSDGRTVATADLGNLGIVRYAPTPFPSPDSSARVQIEMYCETLTLTV